jgi:LuxR family maltose regulon positive regulatory protein
LAFLIMHAPAQMHVMVVTRADPPLPLTSWRARGQQMEIRAADLRFTSDETTHFLNTNTGLNLTRAEMVALEDRTEGWVVGLQLAVMALQGQDADRVPGFITEATSNNRFVVDYFLEEVLRAQDAGVQDFLRRTSLLGRLTAPLCDAVTGRNDSGEILAHLEQKGLFVGISDCEQRSYRYHALFADVLRKLLTQDEPLLVRELHRRAAAWLADNHWTSEAITHALAAADVTHAADLIERVGMETLQRGEVTTLLNWLDALPGELIRDRPHLCLYYASALMTAGRFDEVEPLLTAAEQGLLTDHTDPDADAVQSLFATIRATFAARYGDESQVVALTCQALDCCQEDPEGMTGIRSWLRGLAYVFASQNVDVSFRLSEALSASQSTGEPCMVALETYAYGLVEVTRGRLSRAAAAYRRALASLAERGEGEAPVAGLVHLGLGELLRMQNDLVAAESALMKGLRLARRLNDNGAMVQGYVAFAWLSYARGDIGGALATLGEAEELAQGRAWARSLDLVRAQRARLLLALGRLEEAAAWVREYVARMDARLGSVDPDLVSQAEFLAWAQVRITQGRPAEVLADLEALRVAAEAAGWLRLRLECTALLALAWQAQGDGQRGLACLEEALSLAEPEGYIALFIDLGAPMARLLAEAIRRAALRQPHLQVYVTGLLAAYRMQGIRAIEGHPSGADGGTSDAPAISVTPAYPAGAMALVEPLSAREIEVLELVASGLSNQAIADRLFIGLATVKTHTHHIYEKLGVQNRQQALLRAGELALLDGYHPS